MKVHSTRTIPFRGMRDYVHGTDLYNAMIQIALEQGEPLTDVTFTINHMIFLNEMRFDCLGPEDVAKIKSYPSTLKYCRGGESCYVSARPVDNATRKDLRQQYDEDGIISLCTLSDGQAILAGESPLSFVETLIPMHKAVLNQVAGAQKRNWVFVRLDLAEVNDCETLPPELTVSFDMSQGNRIFRSSIFSSKQMLGHIYFMGIS